MGDGLGVTEELGGGDGLWGSGAGDCEEFGDGVGELVGDADGEEVSEWEGHRVSLLSCALG